jgi:hypothetical protein
MRIDTRTYKLDKRNEFKFRNVCLLKGLKIKKTREIRNVTMIVNDIEITPTKTNANNFIFDIENMRNHMREVLGLDEQEHNLIRLETTFVYNDLQAMSFYKNIDHKKLKNFLFVNEELKITFKVSAARFPDYLDVEEEYIISDLKNNNNQN